jgi:hypothetical protein
MSNGTELTNRDDESAGSDEEEDDDDEDDEDLLDSGSEDGLLDLEAEEGSESGETASEEED